MESDSPEVKPLDPQQIIKDREAAAAKRGPMDAADSDVIGHPSDGFNAMAEKLDKAMKEVLSKSNVQKDPTPAPDDSDKKTTDSKKKPAENKESKTPDAPKDDKATADPENFTSAKAADWKKLKALREEAEKKASEIQAKYDLTAKEYEEFRKKVGDPARLEALNKRIAEVEAEREKMAEILKREAIEKTEEFNSHWNGKLSKAIAKAKEAVGEEHAERVEQLMALPPSKWRKAQLNEIREEVEGLDADMFAMAVANYDEAREGREAQLKDSKATYENLKNMRIQDSEAARKMAEQKNEAALAAVLSVARESMPAFKRTDDTDHNAQVDAAEQFATRFFKKQLSDSELALLPVLAMEAKRYSERVVPSLEKKVAELEAALAEYRGAQPTPGGGTKDQRAAGAGGGGGKSGSSFIDKFNEYWPQGNR